MSISAVIAIARQPKKHRTNSIIPSKMLVERKYKNTCAAANVAMIDRKSVV